MAYERNARGANLHPGVNLHPGANLHRVQIVHMITVLSRVMKIAEHALTCRICLRKVNKLDSKFWRCRLHLTFTQFSVIIPCETLSRPRVRGENTVVKIRQSVID